MATEYAVSVPTYVAAMEEIRDRIEIAKQAVKAMEGGLSAAEQAGSQDAIGFGLNAAVDTTAGKRVYDLLGALVDDCYLAFAALYDVYEIVDDLEYPEG